MNYLTSRNERTVLSTRPQSPATSGGHCSPLSRAKANTQHVSREIHSKSRLWCCDWAPLSSLAFCKRLAVNRQPGRNRSQKNARWRFGRSPRFSPTSGCCGDLTLQQDRRLCDGFEIFSLGLRSRRFFVLESFVNRQCDRCVFTVERCHAALRWCIGCPFACVIPCSSTSEPVANSAAADPLAVASSSLPVVSHLAALAQSQPAARSSRHCCVSVSCHRHDASQRQRWLCNNSSRTQ